ncbi:MAG: helix-turn-helix domain-containing protein [Roseiarcus sp.]
MGTRLLAALTRAESPLMLRDIAAEADLAPAQAHAYLASFRRIELVEQETGSGRYLLGPAAIKLAMARFRGSEVISAANREAKTLSQDLGVMVAIVVWGPHAPTVIVAHEAAAPLEINIRAGTRFSAIESACGHVFAAFGNVHGVGDRAVAELSAATENPTSLSNLKVAFQNAIAQAREQGYSWLENKSRAGHQFCLGARFLGRDLELAIMLVGAGDRMRGGSDSEPISRLLSSVRVAEFGLSAASGESGKRGGRET